MAASNLKGGVILALVAVACRTLPSGSGEVPSAIRVVCERGGPLVPNPIVRAQPDGVHVIAENATSKDLGISYRQGLSGAGANADRGTTEIVWPIAPGFAEILCDDPLASISEDSPWAGIVVVDPEGLWVSPDLDCWAQVQTQGGHSVEPPQGDPRDPVEIAAAFFRPLQEGDVIEPAGYPQAEQRLVRLFRGGHTVAVAEYVDAYFAGGEPGSGWVQHGYRACHGVIG